MHGAADPDTQRLVTHALLRGEPHTLRFAAAQISPCRRTCPALHTPATSPYSGAFTFTAYFARAPVFRASAQHCRRCAVFVPCALHAVGSPIRRPHRAVMPANSTASGDLPRRFRLAALHRRTSPALDLYIKLQARSLLPRSLRRTGFSFAHRSFPCGVSRACSNCSIDRSAFSRVRLLCIISPSKMFHVKHFLIPSVILFHVKHFCESPPFY